MMDDEGRVVGFTVNHPDGTKTEWVNKNELQEVLKHLGING